MLELNASDERGIDVVRNKIKMFAQKKVSCLLFFISYGFCVLKCTIFQVTLPAGKHKIVILDEADSMFALSSSHTSKL